MNQKSKIFFEKYSKNWLIISSVVLRAGLLSTLWVSAVLITLVTISAFFYRESNERNFERLLNAHLYSLIGAVSLTPEGVLQGEPELGDIRYNDPSSGWYWEVMLLDGDKETILKSPSLLGENIASPPESDFAFDHNFIRLYPAYGVQNQDILIIESDIVIEAQNQIGEQSRVARFRIMGNAEEVESRLIDFWATMRGYLMGFIAMSAIINALMIILGLRPLKKIKTALSAVRTGQASHVDIDLPLEIQPMAQEMNALIDNQRHMTERFRTQLGNLAHAMKTPLSVMINEATKMGHEKTVEQSGQLILEQAHIMQNQIQHHLQRAQMAAQRGSLVARTHLQPVMERIGRVMDKLFPTKKIHLEGFDKEFVFAGEAQDLEEIIGNLLENAGKWAESTIWLRTQPMATASFVRLIVEDDGTGLNEAQRHQALQRGQRLDESVPGSGLGLSIVAELVREYGGDLHLDQSSRGGLRVEVTLPLVS